MFFARIRAALGKSDNVMSDGSPEARLLCLILNGEASDSPHGIAIVDRMEDSLRGTGLRRDAWELRLSLDRKLLARAISSQALW